MAKRSTKKKASKKRTTRKKAARSKGKDIEHQQPHPDNMDTRVAVWEAYQRIRSVAGVARELDIKVWIVRDIIDADRQRVFQIIDQHMEQFAAGCEEQATRALSLMHDSIEITAAMMDEIKAAAAEGRLTNIRNRDGFCMPVLDAIQYMVVSRLIDQLAKVAQTAHGISTAYRTGSVSMKQQLDDAGDKGIEDFSLMTDMQIAAILRAANFALPPMLDRKVKQVESQQKTPGGRASSPSRGET